MRHHSSSLKLALAVVLWGVPGCVVGDLGAGDPADRVRQVVTLGQDASLWWNEVYLCGPDDLTPDFVMGTGTAKGTATIANEEETETDALGYTIEAPSGTDSMAMKVCALRATFSIAEDPSLAPGTIQSMLGSVVCDIDHLGVVGTSRNYIISIKLSVLGGTGNDTKEDEITYCLVDQATYCWWGSSPYIDVCTYQGAGCNDPYQSVRERLKVADIGFEAGYEYTIELEAVGTIASVSGDLSQGGRIDFDIWDIIDLQVLFGI